MTDSRDSQHAEDNGTASMSAQRGEGTRARQPDHCRA